MKKTFVSILIGLFMVGVSGQAWAGNVVAADIECTNPTGCVQGYEISDGAITEPKLATGAVSSGKIADGAVTNGKLADWSVTGSKISDYAITDTKIASNAVDTSKIADGAVTDAKITGPISAAKLEKPANVVVVATSGGDYTSIAAALAAINPSANNRYVIKVMPGTYYTEYAGQPLTMKSYVHLEGAGKDVTTIYGQTSPIISCPDITNVTISGFTITTNDLWNDVEGINIGGSSFATIEDNHFTGAALLGVVANGSPRTVIIRNNAFTYMGNHYNDAISLGRWTPSSLTISDNLFKGNYVGIKVSSGSPEIKGNTFTENGSGINIEGNGTATIKDNVISGNSAGLQVHYGSPIIIHNKITGNGTDIVATTATAHISYNIFDLLGTVPGYQGSYVGKYNLKSDGTDAPTTAP